jgi:PAS domain S-box-containing protein
MTLRIADHPARVLIVDDEPTNCRLLEVMLASERFELQIATNGPEALAMVALRPPDLVLLDVMMPGMDGYAVATAIKSDPATKTIPIIMVTVRDDREAKLLGLRAGAEDFLSKPVDRAELCVRVRNLLRLKAYADYHDKYGQLLETEVATRTRALVDSEARYRRIVETAGEGVWELDAHGATAFVNARMAMMLGYETTELIGHMPTEYLVEDDIPAFLANLAQIRARHTQQLELRFRRKDGNTLWTLLETSPIFDAAGEFAGSLAMAMDITARMRDVSERKRGEQLLLERMQVAALGADIGSAVTTGKTLHEVLQRCAEAIVMHLGVATTQIWTFTAATRLELRASAGAALESGVATTEPVLEKFDIDALVRDPQPYLSNDLQHDPLVLDHAWAQRERLRAFSGYPLVVDGELVGLITAFAHRPLTEVAQRALAATADTISIRIRGKLAEQVNAGLEEQLRQAQKMEAVGRLAGGVAHDFNNLLSVILSYADFAIEDLDAGDPLRADIEEIRRAGLRAADLTRQLLMFSRQQVIAPKVLDLNEVLARMGNMLQRIVGEDVALTVTPAATLGCVRVDPGSIEQVIMNLVINARDAMPGGGQLTLETANVMLDEHYVKSHHGAKPGPHIMVSVRDTGTGMDQATVARIFEPFFTTKESGKGTGLGLSTVFGITQQSGGTIWVYSEPGIGTTFEVYLPEVDAASDAPEPARDGVLRRGTETVLLVEDEDQVRGVARGILKRSGYIVLEARNAGEALLLCERHPTRIDLLLSDVVMPGMSGPELAKRLAAARPEMKVLCMSGYTDDAAVRHGVIDAHFAYIQKPLTVDTLNRKVREVLERS